MNENKFPPLPNPKFTETIRGVPCITVTEHEHLMRAYALQARAQVQGEPLGEVFYAAAGGDDETGAGYYMESCVHWFGKAPAADAKLYTTPQPAHATQAEVTDEQILEVAEPFGAFEYGDAQGDKRIDFARAILALQKNNFSHERVPMTHKQAIEMNDAAFDKYMTQDARAIELVRSVEAHHSIKPKEQA